MENWRRVWRDGFVPGLPLAGLRALAEALRTDDPRLCQGHTVVAPPPVWLTVGLPIEAACAIGFCGWQDGLDTVTEIEMFLAKRVDAADTRLNQFGESRHFLNWFDESPRDVVRRELLPEVELAIRAKESLAV